MAIYSKRQLREQQEIITAVMALTALTVFRLQQTSQILTETQTILKRIDESIKRVFEIYPSTDPVYLKKRQEFLAKKKRTVSKSLLVFISSNSELYGDLVWNISKLFLADLKKGQNNALVIGKLGRTLIEKENLSNRITYFDLDDDKPDLKVVQQILEILEQYDKVIVYHGRSESLLRQIPTRSEVLKEMPMVIKPAKKYFFEPTAQEVLDFLQTQASINSFHQKVYEAQLARLAARRWIWTKQQLARGRLLETLTLEFLKYKKGITQKQQQVTLSAHRLGQSI